MQGRGSPKPIYAGCKPGERNLPAKTLSKVVLGSHSREDCAKYQAVGDRDTIVCAGGEGKNVCRAESGGPLFDQKTGLLLGVTSWSIEANREYCNLAPGLFSRVSRYIDFINESLGGPDSDANSQCKTSRISRLWGPRRSSSAKNLERTWPVPAPSRRVFSGQAPRRTMTWTTRRLDRHQGVCEADLWLG